MDAGLRTPLLDFFRRGEVARDVRLMAAQGAIAPRPLEQMGLLMILSSDPDTEIRQTAEATLALLPTALIAGFIARADVPTELRAFFVARGIEPAAVPSPDSDFEEPLVDADAGGDFEQGKDEDAQTFTQRLANMTVPEKVKCAMKGTREMRSVLIRDPNRMVAAAVLSCPKVNEAEVEAFAKMGNVSEDILRSIAMTRAWTKNYGVTLGLVKNSKTPLAMSLNLLQRLNDRDVRMLTTDRNVPEALRLAARKKLTQTKH
jgi:hypothetical protein